MTDLESAFAKLTNSMITAMMDAGADPLKMGAVRAHAEQLSFMLERIDNRLARIEARITRQDTRQKGQKRQQPTGENVVEFPRVG